MDEAGSPEGSQPLDPCACLICGADQGYALPTIAGVPVCPGCEPGVRRRPFPAWITVSFAGLLVLLGVSLYEGRPYFEAAQALTRAERAMEEGRHAEASLLLGAALEAAPTSDKVILRKIKADLLSGDAASGYELIERWGDRSADAAVIDEINAILARVEPAAAKYAEGQALAAAGDLEAAVGPLREAATLYPESATLRASLSAAEASVAFDRGDYARMEAIATEFVETFPDAAMPRGMLASALAARWAETGEVGYRSRSEEAVEQALALAAEDERAAIEDYAERIRHRIDTREILSREEYELRVVARREATPR